MPTSLLAFFRLSSSSALTKEASVSKLPTKQAFISTMICDDGNLFMENNFLRDGEDLKRITDVYELGSFT